MKQSASPRGDSTFPASAPGGVEPVNAFGAADLDALLPVKVRVHALTRLERTPVDALGREPWQIACHVELRDAFGHTTKGLGRLRVELYRPQSDRAGGPETQDAVWNIDLRDARENAVVYDDLVTRTYTVYLASLPVWLHEWADKAEVRRNRAETAVGEAGEFVTLKVYFITQGRNGRERIFESSYRLPG